MSRSNYEVRRGIVVKMIEQAIEPIRNEINSCWYDDYMLDEAERKEHEENYGKLFDVLMHAADLVIEDEEDGKEA